MGCIYRRKKKLEDGTLIETGPYWVKYYRNGRPMRESCGSEKEGDAKQLLKLREGDIARGVPVTPKVGRVTIDELIEDVINDYRTNGQKSADDLRYRINHLLPFFGGRRAADITTADIRRYIVARQAGASQETIENELLDIQRDYAARIESVQKSGCGKRDMRKRLGQVKREWKQTVAEAKGKAGAANATVNRELSLLRRALTLAVQSKKLIAKAHVPMLAENNVRTGFFEFEQ